MNAGSDFTTLQKFIVGRLSDDEHRAFEERLVREPALVRELEQSLRMREGLQQLRTQGYFGRAPSRGGRLRFWAPALAAAAVAGLALFLWLSHVSAPSPILMASLESRAAGDVTPSVAAHFTFAAFRGSSVPDLDLPRAGLIEIRAAPSTRQTIPYRVTLVRKQPGGSAEVVAALTGVVLSADGYLYCYADAYRLMPGRYFLRVEPETVTSGRAEEFPFKLGARVTGSSR